MSFALKGAHNAQFSFGSFPQNFERSYFWNGNRYQQTVKQFLKVFPISQ